MTSLILSYPILSSSSPVLMFAEAAVDPTAVKGVPGLPEVPRAVAGVAVAAAVADPTAPEAAVGREIKDIHRMAGAAVMTEGGRDTATAKMTPSRANTC